MNRKHSVRLTHEEGEQLKSFVSKGKEAANKIKRDDACVKVCFNGEK